jgi:hypothetical protein
MLLERKDITSARMAAADKLEGTFRGNLLRGERLLVGECTKRDGSLEVSLLNVYSY